MDNPHDDLFRRMQDAGEGNQAFAAARKRWLRRMMALLGTSCLAFALTAIWLGRQVSQSPLQSADSQAEQVVQAHFAAIDRGDFRAAYALFSTRLRREMPFEEFHEIMQAHLPLLRGRVSVYPETTSAGRVVVNIAFHGRQPVGLTAEFTLVRNRGRWWIDNFHWNIERPRPEHLILT